jgi:membrane protease YdiL (CAAX protease family)
METVMTEQTQPLESVLNEYEDKANAKTVFERFGWALVALFGVWYASLFLISFVIGVMEVKGIPAMTFYARYMLFFNELTLAFGVVAAMLVMRSMPRCETVHETIGFKRFLQYIAIATALGMTGNLIGQVFLAFWNGATGNEAGGEVSELLLGSDGLSVFLMLCVVAPFLEEFLFRKVLIDHTRKYGELVCILTSGVLYGLFHGNFTQFFYAFGLGALLAHVYFKSGKFFVAFMFHVSFNIFFGVLPTIVLSKGSILALVLYEFVYLSIVITGIVLLIIELQRFKPKKGEISLPKKTMATAVMMNPGMIAAILVMAVRMLHSLFAR